MEFRRADPMNPAGSNSYEKTRYRVLLWNEPLSENSAWRLDEWEVYDADSVLAVIRWAEGLDAHSFEVFVQYQDHATEPTGTMVPVDRFVRVHGTPADDGGTVEVIEFTRD